MNLYASAQQLIITAKAASRNYGAKAGQAIIGALGRGGNGQFARIGPGSLLHGPNAGKKGGKKGSSKAPAAKRADILKASGLSEGEAGALEAFSKGGNLDPKSAAALQAKGLVTAGADGKFRLAPNAKSAVLALKRGDQRAVEDAVSKAADRQAKLDGKAGKAAGAGKAGKAEKPKSGPASKAPAIEAAIQKIDHKVDEYAALAADTTKPLGALAKQKLVHKVQELKTKLSQTVPGGKPEIHKKLDDLIAKLTPPKLAAFDAPEAAPAAKEFRGSLAVFKQADGQYRWTSVSSNAFEDRDGEIIATKALEADVERTDATGDYGPLRWWHCGGFEFETPLDWATVKAGPGIDIGTCDFSAMQGRMLIESGLCASKEIADGISSGDFEISIGFSHPINEPVNGTYEHIRRFERSVLPAGKASNPYTTIKSMEVSDMATSMKDKIAAFKNLFGNNGDAADQFIAAVTEKEKEVEAGGVAFKAAGEPDMAADAAGGDPAAEAAAEGEPVEEETNEMTLVADLTAGQLVDMIVQAIQAGGVATAELGKKVGEAFQVAAKEINGAKAKAAADVAATNAEIAKLKERLAELEGNAPKSAGYRASLAPESIVKGKAAIAAAAPMTDIERAARVFAGEQ